MAAGRLSQNPSSNLCVGWHPGSSAAAGREGGRDAGEMTSLSAAVLPLKPAEAPPAEVTLHSPHPFLCLFLPPPPPSSRSLLLCFPIKPFLVSPWRWCQSQRWGVAGQPALRSQTTAWCGAGWRSEAWDTSSPPRAERGPRGSVPSLRVGRQPPPPHKDAGAHRTC